MKDLGGAPSSSRSHSMVKCLLNNVKQWFKTFLSHLPSFCSKTTLAKNISRWTSLFMPRTAFLRASLKERAARITSDVCSNFHRYIVMATFLEFCGKNK